MWQVESITLIASVILLVLTVLQQIRVELFYFIRRLNPQLFSHHILRVNVQRIMEECCNQSLLMFLKCNF